MPITVTNLTTDRTFDANSVSIDELADVLGTLIEDIEAGSYLGSQWTVTNGVTDRTLDAQGTTIDELADVIATFIADNPTILWSLSISVDSFIADNDLDCDNTSLTELAHLLGTLTTLITIAQRPRYARRPRLTIPGSQQPNLR
jgi:hypothetical protein